MGENSAGRKEFTFNVNVFGRPGKIDGTIELTEIAHDTITLAWNPPKDNGGADITNYIVERKEIETQNFWYTVNANCNRNICTVRKLNTNMDYMFRIAAENKFGMSEWVESPVMQPRHKFRVPTAPSQPTVDKIKADSMVVSWEAPASDGGSKVEGYLLERKETNAIIWTKVNTIPMQKTEFRVANLIEGLEYQFRVRAVNSVGESNYSELSKQKKAFNSVSAPTPPEVTSVLPDQVTMIWKAPRDDGGAPIIAYDVEKRSGGEDARWYKCSYTSVDECEFTAIGLTEGQAYQFRV